MTIQDILDILKQGGIVGLLLVFQFGLIKRWWVMGQFYDEKSKEAEEWKQAALHGTYAAREAVTLAQKLGPDR